MIEDDRRVVNAEPEIGCADRIGRAGRQRFDVVAHPVTEIPDRAAGERDPRQLLDSIGRHDCPQQEEGIGDPFRFPGSPVIEVAIDPDPPGGERDDLLR